MSHGIRKTPDIEDIMQATWDMPGKPSGIHLDTGDPRYQFGF